LRPRTYPHCLQPHCNTVDDVVAATAQVKLRYARGPVGLGLPRTLFFVCSASETLRALTAVFRGLGFDVFYIDLGGLQSTVLRDNREAYYVSFATALDDETIEVPYKLRILGRRTLLYLPPVALPGRTLIHAWAYNNQPDREQTYGGCDPHVITYSEDVMIFSSRTRTLVSTAQITACVS
jgi:hypothetical protein